MALRRFLSVLVLSMVLVGCSSDSYESLTKEVSEMASKQLPMSDADRARVESLREQGEQMQQDGKTEEAVAALKQARDILQKAADAELLGKSDG